MYNSPNALKKGILATFDQMLQTKKESFFKDYWYRTKSDGHEDEFWVPSSLPGFLEWLDAINFVDIDDKSFKVYNKHYQRGVLVNRDFLADTRKTLGGKIEAFLKTLSDNYVNFPDALCQYLLDNNPTAFDGTAMFATSRPNLDTGTNTINNLISGTLSSSYTTSTFNADVTSAIAAMRAMKDKENNPFNPNPKLVALIPAAHESIARKVLEHDTYYDAATSVLISSIWNNIVTIAVNDRQADNDWYLINTNANFQPFLILDRENIKWEMKDDMELKNIKYWADFRMGYNVLNPMSIIKINN